MRVISKVVVNRLQNIIDKVISPMQAAFIKGRNIIDNVAISHEIADFIKKKRAGKTSFASIKLDMAKAFDRMEWSFLRKILLCLGFHEVWVDKIMKIISTVTYHIRINGEVSNVIFPSRGLRQGDPLSPYLFILGTEWLSTLMSYEQSRNNSFGIKICRGAPNITHLFFADDSMFFLKNSLDNFRAFKLLLSKYEFLSGQLINYEKSEVVFSRNTSSMDKANYLHILGVSEVHHHSKYLGLPTVLGRNKSCIFNDLVDKIGNRIKNWRASLLSSGGKEVLIKAVLQALPQYTFNMFKVPDKIISKLTSLINRFWWSSNMESHGAHWVKKDVLIKKKEEGGLGFRDLRLFNIAMLAKQGWRIMNDPDMLVSKLLKAKYFPNNNIIDARLGYRPSFGWRSLMAGLDLIRKGCHWCPSEGKYIWNHEDNRMYSVKSGYNLALQQEISTKNPCGISDSSKMRSFWRGVWRSHLPNKIKIFCWKLYHKGLPAGENLKRMNLDMDISCKNCSFHEESILHSMIRCWWAKQLWALLNLSWVSRWPSGNNSPADWIFFCKENSTNEEFSLIMVAAWYCWYNRNLIWHGKNQMSPRAAKTRIQVLSKAFASYNFWNSKVMQDRDLNWKAPDHDFIKFNCDGSYNKLSKTGSIGIIARAFDGSVWYTHGSKISNCTSALDAEGRALQKAMEAAKLLGYNQVIFEVDSAALVENILSGASSKEAGKEAWMLNCQSMLMKMDLWSLRLIVREANNQADSLARKVLHLGWSWVEASAIPRCIQDCVLL